MKAPNTCVAPAIIPPTLTRPYGQRRGCWGRDSGESQTQGLPGSEHLPHVNPGEQGLLQPSANRSPHKAEASRTLRAGLSISGRRRRPVRGRWSLPTRGVRGRRWPRSSSPGECSGETAGGPHREPARPGRGAAVYRRCRGRAVECCNPGRGRAGRLQPRVCVGHS